MLDCEGSERDGRRETEYVGDCDRGVSAGARTEERQIHLAVRLAEPLALRRTLSGLSAGLLRGPQGTTTGWGALSEMPVERQLKVRRPASEWGAATMKGATGTLARGKATPPAAMQYCISWPRSQIVENPDERLVQLSQQMVGLVMRRNGESSEARQRWGPASEVRFPPIADIEPCQQWVALGRLIDPLAK